MPDPHWENLKQIFHAALALAPAERVRYLNEACNGDTSLRRAVESLLTSHERTGNFVDLPAYQAAAEMLVDSANFQPGQNIAHYRIIQLLGEGGMGTVYLAEDTKLHRKVSLKFLPSRFIQDRERLRRFEQEARATSALNHPNIIHIYEIGQADSTEFIAAEYLDGTTLRAYLATTAVQSSDVLDIAMQVASALAAAHAKGVVHRDIKPENIMVLRENYSLHRENYVKVLDFGIAKLTELAASHTEIPTKPLIDTNQGVVLGTVSYMSPEQARGLVVDARTDIWSLGVVLYEMLANQLPFAGDTVEDIRAAILKDKPLPLPPEIPERFKWIVAKALRKDREDRYQTVREVFSDLRELQQELASENLRETSPSQPDTLIESTRSGRVAITGEPLTGSTNHTAAPPISSAEYIVGGIKRHKRGALIISAGLLLITSGLAYGLISLWRHKQPKAKLSSQSIQITRLTDNGHATAPAISPDGNYLAYVRENEGKVGLWLKQVGQATEREIVPSTDSQIVGATFSRDGSLIYYTVAEPLKVPHGILYQIPTMGGTTRKVSENISGAVSLSPDGKHLAFVRTTDGSPRVDSLIVANSDGTAEQILVSKEGRAYIDSGPTWSPDGKSIAYGAAVEPDFQLESVAVMPVDGGREKWITPQRWSHVDSPVWLRDGASLIVLALANRTAKLQLWEISYPGGEADRITNDLDGYLEGSLSVTADSNSIVAAREDRSSRLWVTPIGEGEDRARQISVGKFDGLNGVSWTPDGKILCLLKTDDDFNIWLMNRDGTGRRQLTADSALKMLPQMSPDGLHVVFSSLHGEYWNIWMMDADGSNQKQLTKGIEGNINPRFTADGQWVVFCSGTELGSPKIRKVSIEGGEPVELVDYWTVLPTISPDGKLIAAGHRDKKGPQLAIIPISGGQPTKLLPLPATARPGSGLGWMSDSSTLVYTDNRGGVSNIWSQAINGDPPKQLTNFKSDLIFSSALSADGQELVLARGSQTRDVVLIRNFH